MVGVLMVLGGLFLGLWLVTAVFKQAAEKPLEFLAAMGIAVILLLLLLVYSRKLQEQGEHDRVIDRVVTALPYLSTDPDLQDRFKEVIAEVKTWSLEDKKRVLEGLKEEYRLAEALEQPFIKESQEYQKQRWQARQAIRVAQWLVNTHNISPTKR